MRPLQEIDCNNYLIQLSNIEKSVDQINIKLAKRIKLDTGKFLKLAYD